MRKNDPNPIGKLLVQSERRLLKAIASSITESEKRLKKDIFGVESELKMEISGLGEVLSQQIVKNSKKIEENSEHIVENSRKIEENSERIIDNSRKIEENSFDIRRNGVLMEDIQNAMELVVEGNVNNYEKTGRLEKEMKESKLEKIPVLWDRIKTHAARLKKLEINSK